MSQLLLVVAAALAVCAVRVAGQSPTIETTSNGGVTISVAAGAAVRVQRMNTIGQPDGPAQELYTKDQVDAIIAPVLGLIEQHARKIELLTENRVAVHVALQQQEGDMTALSDLLAQTRLVRHWFSRHQLCALRVTFRGADVGV